MKDTEETRSLFEKVKNLMNGMRYEEALKILQRLLEKSPENSEIICTSCILHINLEFDKMTKEEVIILAEKALKLNNELAITWNTLAILYLYNDQYEKAIKYGNTALERDSGYKKNLMYFKY